MSPHNAPPNRGRFVVLPLPIWGIWLALQAVWWATQLLLRLVRQSRPSRSGERTDQATQHSRSDCRQLAERLLGYLNEYRAAQGLRPLRWNPRLEASALYQSKRMSELGEFDHVLSDGVELDERIQRAGYRYTACGENLFWVLDPSKGVAALAWTIHDGWVHSAGHQKNLVGDWTEVGIGVAPDGEGGFYATQNFGVPQNHIALFDAFATPTHRARRA